MRSPKLLACALLAIASSSIASCSDAPSNRSSREERLGGSARPETRRAATQANRTPIRPEDVSFAATDGMRIHATLWRAPEQSSPAVVLVHQLSRDRSEWTPLVNRLTRAPALSVLAIDLRGHGASTRRPSGETIEWSGMTTDDWRAIELDVAAAVRFVRPGAGARLAAPKVAIVGSSIGSSAAVRAAVLDDAVVAVAALSPGRAYRGVDSIAPLRHWGSRRLWVLATTRDRASAEAAYDMRRVVRQSVGRIVEGQAHGLEMASEVPGLFDEIASFVREALDVT